MGTKEMKTLSRRALCSRWRKRLFIAWVGASLLVAIYAAVAGPVAGYIGEGRSFIAIAVMGLMFFMLLTGFGWLAMFVFSKRSSGNQG